MLDCTVFLTSDFPAVALVVCSEEEAAHGFDRLSHNDGSRAFQEVGGSCGESERRDFRLNSLQGLVKRGGD